MVTVKVNGKCIQTEYLSVEVVNGTDIHVKYIQAGTIKCLSFPYHHQDIKVDVKCDMINHCNVDNCVDVWGDVANLDVHNCVTVKGSIGNQARLGRLFRQKCEARSWKEDRERLKESRSAGYRVPQLEKRATWIYVEGATMDTLEVSGIIKIRSNIGILKVGNCANVVGNVGNLKVGNCAYLDCTGTNRVVRRKRAVTC